MQPPSLSSPAEHSPLQEKPANYKYVPFQSWLCMQGLWEITKGKGRAITQPPSWVWDGLAVHAPNAAELACRATDVASAAKYFEVWMAACNPRRRHMGACINRLPL